MDSGMGSASEDTANEDDDDNGSEGSGDGGPDSGGVERHTPCESDAPGLAS
jgi:hypothetical protein